MRHFFLFLHLAGLALWMGGGFSLTATGVAALRMPREQLGIVVRLQAAIHNRIVLPGVLAVVISGLVLTLRLYSSASVTGIPLGIMVMQGTGLLAASIVFVVTVPTIARLARLEPVGEYAAAFDALRKKAAVSGGIIALLAIIALIAGVMIR